MLPQSPRRRELVLELKRFDPKRLADLAPVVAQRLREEGASFRFYVLEANCGSFCSALGAGVKP